MVVDLGPVPAVFVRIRFAHKRLEHGNRETMRGGQLFDINHAIKA